MTTVGQLGKFNPEEENISAHLDCVELYLIANGVKEERKVAVLLSVIGPKSVRNTQRFAGSEKAS